MADIEKTPSPAAPPDPKSGGTIKVHRGIKVHLDARLPALDAGSGYAVEATDGGAEIARTEWYREGRVPLHTLRADIDYGTAEAETTYGIIGVKVWIFKGEVFEGNAPQNPELIAQLKYAKAREIPVLNCTQCMRGRVNMGGYATGHGLQEVGVLSGSDMTPEAALAKLHYLLSKGLAFEKISQLLTQNLHGELSD